MMLLGVGIIWSVYGPIISSQPGNINNPKKFPHTEIPREVDCLVRYYPTASPIDGSQIGNDVTNSPEPPVQPQLCECVPYYLCNQNRTISQDGDGLVDIRFSLLSGVGLVSTPPFSSCPCNNATSTTKP